MHPAMHYDWNAYFYPQTNLRNEYFFKAQLSNAAAWLSDNELDNQLQGQ